MATKKKWIKPVLIVGGIAVVAFFGLPVLMNYLRPGGTVNPTLPMSTPASSGPRSAYLMPSAFSGIW